MIFHSYVNVYQRVINQDFSSLTLPPRFWSPRCRPLQVRFVQKAEDILSAERLIFPGVGAFGACVDALQRKGFMEPLRLEDQGMGQEMMVNDSYDSYTV